MAASPPAPCNGPPTPNLNKRQPGPRRASSKSATSCAGRNRQGFVADRSLHPTYPLTRGRGGYALAVRLALAHQSVSALRTPKSKRPTGPKKPCRARSYVPGPAGAAESTDGWGLPHGVAATGMDRRGTRRPQTRKKAAIARSLCSVSLSLSTANGGRGGNRTPDTGIFNPLLYQLSYPAGTLQRWAVRARHDTDGGHRRQPGGSSAT